MTSWNLPRRLLSALKMGLLSPALYGVPALLAGLGFAAWSLPAFLTMGGPFFPPTEDKPTFGPAHWKRGCAGFVLHEQRPDGEWLACLGLPFGSRQEYRNLNDSTPWSVRPVPPGVSGHRIFRDVREGSYLRAEVLAWKRGGTSEEVLAAAQSTSGQWAITHAYLASDDRGPRWREHVIYDAPSVGSQEWTHRPSDSELNRFLDLTDWMPHDYLSIHDWGVNPSAWAWLTGKADSAALRGEVDRVKSYRRSD